MEMQQRHVRWSRAIVSTSRQKQFLERTIVEVARLEEAIDIEPGHSRYQLLKLGASSSSIATIC